METISFQSVVRDNTILIPKEYKGKIKSPVFVLVAADMQEPHIIRTRTKKKPFTAKDFTSIKTNLGDWKFNREEANERR
jgi:hypothetical protein